MIREILESKDYKYEFLVNDKEGRTLVLVTKNVENMDTIVRDEFVTKFRKDSKNKTSGNIRIVLDDITVGWKLK